MISTATIIVLCVIAYGVVLLFALALCKVAKQADELEARLLADYHRRHRDDNVIELTARPERMTRDRNLGEQVDG